jgi:DNA polymerase III delta prime subunit
MKFIKQKEILEIQNLDKIVKDNKQINRHSKLLPNIVRSIIVGPSGCGKTNVIIALLQDKNGLKFENVHVFSKSIEQPKYKYIENLFSKIKGIEYKKFSNNTKLQSLDDAKSNTVIIFDDVSSEVQSSMKDYFSRGRHKFINCFYICQSYICIPKNLIRENSNLLIVFKVDKTSMFCIHRDHVNSDMTFEIFSKVCRICWKKDYGFLVINKDCDLNKGRYRSGFHDFLEFDQTI